MVKSQQDALEIAIKARERLEQIYGRRLRGVYLYGSAARGQLTPDSDIDIAVILDLITDRFDEHERTSQLASDMSLEHDTLVSFLFVSEADYLKGRFAVHRVIQEEGIRA
jgi:predicted nucleotidyltransferase